MYYNSVYIEQMTTTVCVETCVIVAPHVKTITYTRTTHAYAYSRIYTISRGHMQNTYIHAPIYTKINLPRLTHRHVHV